MAMRLTNLQPTMVRARQLRDVKVWGIALYHCYYISYYIFLLLLLLLNYYCTVFSAETRGLSLSVFGATSRRFLLPERPGAYPEQGGACPERSRSDSGVIPEVSSAAVSDVSLTSAYSHDHGLSLHTRPISLCP